MLNILLSILSLFTGAAFALQSVVNGALRNVTQNPLFASIVSFTGGLLILPWLLIFADFIGICEIPKLSLLMTESRWWMYVGGTMGAILVLGGILLPKHIGFTSYFSLLIAGQLLGSVVTDAMGILGGEVIGLSLNRIVGVLFLLIGAVLAQK